MMLIFSLMVVFAVALHSELSWKHNLFIEFPVTREAPPKGQWFRQYLDQYSPTDDRTWQQRYFTNSEYYEEGGPVFLMLSGEAPANGKWMKAGEMIELAKEYGALCFLLEHRFYGESYPLPDMSVKNLKYLSADHALADVAVFIEEMKKTLKLPENTKWITFGCSYPGSLSAWMRLKYPHLVHGALSTSGPVLAKLDFQEYLIVVERSLKTHSQDCVDSIAAALKEIGIMLRHRDGQQRLEKLFNLCDPLNSQKTSQNDIKNFYASITDMLAFVVQYNNDNRNGSFFSIHMVCNILVDENKGDPVKRLADVSKKFLKVTHETCLNYKYSKMINELRNTTFKNSSVGTQPRLWTYQTCTQFGFYQTSTARPSVFGKAVDVDFYIQQCRDIFGFMFSYTAPFGVKRNNIVYGGLDIVNHVKNVVFIHGSIDPWHALGVTKSDNPDAPAIYINGTGHCADFFPPSPKDLPQLTQARKQISALIGKWLQKE